MSLFSRHSLLYQTAYSELKQAVLEQPRFLVGTPGSVGERVVKGQRFLYRQFYDATGRKSATYLGPVADAEAEARASAAREAIATTNARIRETRELVRAGYARADSSTGAVAAVVANHGLFRAGAAIVGSHAYGALLNELGVKAAPYATLDLDLARGERLPALELSFADILAESTLPLRAVPSFDPRVPSTSYKVAGADRFRVDLLVPGRGMEITTVAVPELQAHATALPFLGALLDRPMDSVLLVREGAIHVRVPRPEAFAWHKMLLSQLRAESRDKQGKDLRQAAVIFAALAEDAPDALADAFAALPRGARGRTRRGAAYVMSLLEANGHPRAAGVLREYA